MEIKHIIAGFKEDLEIIRNEYVTKSPDLKLEDFFSYWSTAHLDCLFANRFDPRELLESIVEMNKRLVDIVTNDLKTLEERLVALYMLFCLAVKQPSRMRRKIRLTCPDAIKIQQLCTDVQQSKVHSDAEFCWHHLRANDAIDFVEDRIIYGPSMLSARGAKFVDRDDLANPYSDARREAQEFIDNKLEPNISYLEGVCTKYNEIRNALDLDNVNDATVELDSRGTVSDCLDQAKSLLMDFKTSEGL